LKFAPDYGHHATFNILGLCLTEKVVVQEMKAFIKGLAGEGIVALAMLATGLLAPQIAQAEGTLYFSNLSQNSAGSVAVGSDSWIAQAFFPSFNPGGYDLNSVQLLMGATSGSPAGFSVSIYTGPRIPEFLVGNLVGPDPSAGGIFTYNASGITLSSGTDYFIVVTAATPLADGAYNWSVADTTSHSGQWGRSDDYFSSVNGLSWSASPSPIDLQFAIFATPAPEPGVIGLFALGGLFVAFQRRKARLAQ
jgi:hypothetical protein